MQPFCSSNGKNFWKKLKRLKKYFGFSIGSVLFVHPVPRTSKIMLTLYCAFQWSRFSKHLTLFPTSLNQWFKNILKKNLQLLNSAFLLTFLQILPHSIVLLGHYITIVLSIYWEDENWLFASAKFGIIVFATNHWV